MKAQLASLLILVSLTASAQLRQQPQISVTGSAEVKVPPDEIRLNVAVETRGETLEPVRAENDNKIVTSLAFLKRCGLSDNDVQTDLISVQPDYDYGRSHVRPVAYIVRKSVEIRLTNITEFQTVLTGLLTNGINVVDGIDLRTTQLRKYRDQARAMAARAAKEKAGALAAEFGAKLGKPCAISIFENSGWSGWNRNGGLNGYNNVVQNGATAGAASPDDGGEAFAAGQISVSATVNASFLIE